MRHVEVLVLGTGGMGSAACAHLARRGVEVVGLEQFSLGHDRGSSHGDTRIIRLAYFEHPDYVPLLRRSYELWHELEQATPQSLYRSCGLLIAGLRNGPAVSGALQAAAQHQLSIEQLTAAEVSQLYPGYRLPSEYVALLERQAGYLAVERCVAAYQQLAQQSGAELIANCPVQQVELRPTSVVVHTPHESFTARKLVVTAGAWTARLLPEQALPLTPSRKVVGWFDVAPGAYHVDAGYPCFYVEREEGAFYGFPSLDGSTMKIAEHSGIDPVADPSQLRRDCRPEEMTRLQAVLRDMFPQATSRVARTSTCLYTMTPDHHFLIDHLPGAPHVTIACGFSGHGFKFASLVGEVLADLALDGTTRWPIDFLRWRHWPAA